MYFLSDNFSMESNKFLDLSYYKFRWVILVLHSNIEYQ